MWQEITPNENPHIITAILQGSPTSQAAAHFVVIQYWETSSTMNLKSLTEQQLYFIWIWFLKFLRFGSHLRSLLTMES